MAEAQTSEQEQSAAIQKKLSNRAWRLNNLYWITNERGEKRKFRMNWAQKIFYAALWYLNVVLKARQLGMSTFSLIFMLDKALFEKDQTCGIIDKTDDDAKKKLKRIEFAYDHLDDPDDPTTAPLGAGIKQAVRLVTTNTKELAFSNNSQIWAGTSLRGGTIQFLLISELGYISFYLPKKAQEIKTGALNTVHKGCIVVIESTHEGGKYGVNYDMIRVAQEAPKEPPALTEMDWRFHFFSWHGNPEYQLALPPGFPLRLDQEMAEYFSKLESEHGIKLSDAQKHWYVKKRATQMDDMLKEFPSTAEEAVNAVVRGAIYGKIVSRLREQKRIADFNHDPQCEIMSFWDLGFSDFTSVWLIQIVGRDVCALRYYCRNQEAIAHYVQKCTEWEREYKQVIAWHYFPHDVTRKNLSDGKSVLEAAIAAGLDRRRCKVVPRVPDLWQGINVLRGLLTRFYFHKTNCGTAWMCDNARMPSGIECLESYHTKEETTAGEIREDPVHDAASHGADALRTFAEAYANGMLEGASPMAVVSRSRPVQVLRGAGANLPGAEARRGIRVIR